jgi:hypothetical protein
MLCYTLQHVQHDLCFLQVTNRFVTVVTLRAQDVELVCQIQLVRTPTLYQQFARRQLVAVVQRQTAYDVYAQINAHIG